MLIEYKSAVALVLRPNMTTAEAEMALYVPALAVVTASCSYAGSSSGVPGNGM